MYKVSSCIIKLEICIPLHVYIHVECLTHSQLITLITLIKEMVDIHIGIVV